MNYLLFLPPLFSIYLISTSVFPKKYLVNTVKTFTNNKSDLKGCEKVIRFVALSWAAKLNFIHSMIMTFFSSYSIWSATKNLNYLIITNVILFVIFLPMFWWIMGHDPDELASRVTKKGHFTHDTVCSVVLIIVNLILLIAIYLSQSIQPVQP